MAELPAAKPTRRRRRWVWPLVGVLVAGAAGTTVAVLASRDDAPPTTTVTFEVGGSAADLQTIVWETPAQGTQTLSSPLSVPWSKTVEITEREGPIWVQAVGDLKGNAGVEGSLTCRITVDGQVVEQGGPTGTFARCWTTVQRVLAVADHPS